MHGKCIRENHIEFFIANQACDSEGEHECERE